jgi:DNA-binding XRE family transcriptional regulator
MNVQFIEEKDRKKFAILPYKEFVQLVELAADQSDYEEALKVLNDKEDEIVDYDPSLILKNPIKLKREKMGISQAQLAKTLKVTQSYVSKLEREGANPSKLTLVKVARALKCPVEELL